MLTNQGIDAQTWRHMSKDAAELAKGLGIEPFCLFLESFVRIGLDSFDRYRDSSTGHMAELLCQMLHAASKSNELVFLSGNPDGELVSGFLHHYTQGCLMFPRSRHVFDMEVSMVVVTP